MLRPALAAATLLLSQAAAADRQPAQPAPPAPSAQPAAPPPSDVERGRLVYDRSNCSNCHAPGGNGPDLRGEGARGRSEAWLREQIATPEKHKPDTIMPPQQLTEAVMADLVAFLKAQRSEGDAKPGVGSDADGKALFEARCRTCHFLPVPASYSFTVEQWPVVVKFMMDGKKASRYIAKGEDAKIVAYLQDVARARVEHKETKR